MHYEPSLQDVSQWRVYRNGEPASRGPSRGENQASPATPGDMPALVDCGHHHHNHHQLGNL